MCNNHNVSADLSPPACIRARCNGHGNIVDRASPYVLERDDYETTPDRRALLRQERQRGSPRDIDFASSDRFLKKAFDDPLICNERFKNRWFTIKADGQSVFCFGKYVAHQCLRAVKRTADVNFDQLEDNKIAKLKSNNAQR